MAYWTSLAPPPPSPAWCPSRPVADPADDSSEYTEDISQRPLHRLPVGRDEPGFAVVGHESRAGCVRPRPAVGRGHDGARRQGGVERQRPIHGVPVDRGARGPGDTNGVSDVFVRNLGDGTVVRVSVSSSGVQANGNSAGGSLSTTGGSSCSSRTRAISWPMTPMASATCSCGTATRTATASTTSPAAWRRCS